MHPKDHFVTSGDAASVAGTGGNPGRVQQVCYYIYVRGCILIAISKSPRQSIEGIGAIQRREHMEPWD